MDSGFPVFYKQTRVGRHNRDFKIIKFRTMVQDADKKGLLLSTSNDPRISDIGTLLRKYKIDELPQLFNVLIGDMSLVGPRPEVRKYVDLFPIEYDHILTVRPGITDYAAIEYKDENAILEKVANKEEVYIKQILPQKIIYYMKYIKDMSLATDMKLIFKTILEILK